VKLSSLVVSFTRSRTKICGVGVSSGRAEVSSWSLEENTTQRPSPDTAGCRFGCWDGAPSVCCDTRRV
jgi:hypothetical protein